MENLGVENLGVETSIEIAAAVQKVWEALTDFATYPDWNPYIVRIEGDAVAGSILTVHAVMRPGAEPMAQEVKLVSLTPYRMNWEGGLPDRALFKGDHWFCVEPTNQGSVFRHFEHFSGTQAAAILAQYRAAIEDNFRIFNEALKRCAETA